MPTALEILTIAGLATALKIRVTIRGVHLVTTTDAAALEIGINHVIAAALEKNARATALEIGVGHLTAALVVTATQMGTKALQIRTDTDQTVGIKIVVKALTIATDAVQTVETAVVQMNITTDIGTKIVVKALTIATEHLLLTLYGRHSWVSIVCTMPSFSSPNEASRI